MLTVQGARPDSPTGQETETFIQRQRRLAGQQAAGTIPRTGATAEDEQQFRPMMRQSAPTGTAVGGFQTPVTGGGKIPPPTGMANPMGAAVQPQTQQPAQPGTIPVPQLPNGPISTYQPTQFQTAIPKPAPLPESYAGTQFSQFAAPDTQATQGRSLNLMNAILDRPETLSPEVLGAMKEKQKEGALLMERQGIQQANSSAAARGMTSGGGLEAIQRAIRGDAASNIINSNRDLDIAAAAQNREDQLRALSQAESVMSGALGRGTEAYKTGLLGQTTQAEDTRAKSADAIQRAIAGFGQEATAAGLGLQKEGMGAEESYRGYQSQREAENAALDRILKQFGMSTTAEQLRQGANAQAIQQGQFEKTFGLEKEKTLADIQRDIEASSRGGRALDIQELLGKAGIDVDKLRISSQENQFGRQLAQQGSQFDKGYGLDILRFLEGQRQSDNQLGLGYNQLSMTGQNALMNAITNILG